MVTINGGHFEVDNEPFFPVGFYYLWDNKLSFTMPPVRTTPALLLSFSLYFSLGSDSSKRGKFLCFGAWCRHWIGK